MITTREQQDRAARVAEARRRYRAENRRVERIHDLDCPGCGRRAGRPCRRTPTIHTTSGSGCTSRTEAFWAERRRWTDGLIAATITAQNAAAP